MEELGLLLRGLAAFLWPTAVIVAVVLFKEQIRGAINSLVRARMPGVEIELDRRLDRLHDQTERLGPTSTPVLEEPSHAEPPSAQRRSEDEEADRDEAEVLATAAQSPQAGLMLLSSKLETEMRRLLYSMGHPPRQMTVSFMARELKRLGGLSDEWLSVADEFQAVRNQLVHGGCPTHRRTSGGPTDGLHAT